jgi:hypothetical protein
MPLYRVLLYFHSFNVMDGGNTRWTNTSSDTDRIDLTELDTLIKDL